ncbi:TfpX/TfpZ family type IV pilin accessory protein [Undibacterium sp. 5I1]|uniref:TfpX/TfpZ family type IV pilin accessory protein n=1 Tax=unclassified Undibacterium TaxID=2630295 RepID=UPI002AB5A179|nr:MULTISPECIES: TfpX/TfpZ family type IV pilin accessory protein [unclassified Undibacterium]MDY7538769.1 TfpX/TfpZ family type IV pilin accessory protein [Undibacterium sp. 5I1]MEB0229708.1 TfpX/TfpZ family type IV pilin accessory protein [Undibacterium sp. 10I3]MEB0258427.1 TfpX/TfpZ family type IV pilin accessory protein [Undibacterium sp. 5I1]
MRHFKYRFISAGCHLVLSALIAAAVTGIVLFLWFPWPYSEICGGLSLLYILISVDVILGPLLTFVVFDVKKNKRHLARDLIVIVIIQMMGLGYGVMTIFSARPVALVFTSKYFRVVTSFEVDQKELSNAKPEFRTLSKTGPILIGMSPSKNLAENVNDISKAMNGFDAGLHPSLWDSYDKSYEQIIKISKPVELLFSKYPKLSKTIEAAVAKSGVKRQQLRYLPLISKNASWVILIDVNSVQPVGFAPIDDFL